ncbi:MAG TPA: ferritin-like domain-containing protein [Solirubrobacteraceae bacterium]|nr:ferritin-like domain-containing protein [Solirubrobacteraceae bacterium]
MTDLTLGALDRDEALSDALAQLFGSTRAGFLRTAALGSAAMLAGLSAPAEADAAVTDVDILQFGLRFERLQATFYTQAEELGTIAQMSSAKQKWARTLGAHERAHVRIIKKVLGPKAEPRPFFDFGKDNETDAGFTSTAVAMEDLTVALLTGVMPQVRDRGLAAALLGLMTVEARHAAWARRIVGSAPVARAFDEPRTLRSVQGVIARTRFIRAQPKKSSRRRPRYTG